MGLSNIGSAGWMSSDWTTGNTFVAVLIQLTGTIKVGGVAKVWHLNEIGGRIRFFDFDPDPTKRTTFWSMLIGFCFYYFFVYSGQTAAQRYCSLPTMRLAKLAILINVPGLFLLGSLSCAAGVVAFAYYSSEHCDPLKQGNIDNSNQIIPYFVMDVLGYPGFPGVFVACLLCGTLSSVSSSLNTMAALVWEDMLKSFFTDINEGKSANITKIIAAVGGCLTIGMGFVMAHARGTLIQTASTVLHIPGTATLGLLFMGALFPRFSWKGACISYLCTVGVCLWLAIGALQSGIHKESLPTSVDGCFGNMTFIYSANTTFLSPKQETVSYNDATLNGTKSINKSNIPIVYQITSFWFPLIGLLVFVVIGTITCFIPGIRETRRIEDQFLHPYVVWLRNRANKKGRRRVRTTDVGMTGPGESIAMAYRNDEPIYHPVATKADLHVDHIGAS